VAHKRVDLVEAARIEQLVDSLAGGELAFFMLGFDASFAATQAAFALALS
jgi:hypothetical protein